MERRKRQGHERALYGREAEQIADHGEDAEGPEEGSFPPASEGDDPVRPDEDGDRR